MIRTQVKIFETESQPDLEKQMAHFFAGNPQIYPAGTFQGWTVPNEGGHVLMIVWNVATVATRNAFGCMGFGGWFI